MSQINRHEPYLPARPQGGSNLVDVLDRVLDKGVVIAGDISIDLLDIELLRIKIRLLIASVDKAKEMGIDWWMREPHLTSRADRSRELQGRDEQKELERENSKLRRELAQLRTRVNDLTCSAAARQQSAGE